MKAVVMAGGEGTRLRPITASMPKPLLPVVNRPIMDHVLRLLRRHGVTETVVTVQFLAALVRDYFGDGEDWGMTLQYVTEETPLGTAGSVKNAEGLLRDEAFLVISGDALTDIDLSALIKFHEERDALVTVCLTRVPDPLDFGITILDEHGRVQRFLEKPTWGQVFSDTVNTGIYVIAPDVLQTIEPGRPTDWAADVFPRLLAAGEDVYGYVAEGYWEDVGTLESYLRVQADALEGKVDLDIDGFEVAPGVRIGEGAEVDPEAVLTGPLFVGDYAKVEAGAVMREHTVLGSNVVVKSGAFLHRAVVHDNVLVGAHSTLRACVVGRNSDLMRAARIEEGAVVGDECIVEEEAIIQAGVKVYPFKTIEAGAIINTSVIFESRGHRSLFGPRGVSGMINVEITPELAVRLASAFATTLKKGSTVTVACDVSRAAGAIKRAMIAALNSGAINVADLEAVPEPVARLITAQGSAGGVMIGTTPGMPDSIDVRFLDATGGDLSHAAARGLERVLSRREYRRAFPGEIGELDYPPRVADNYALDLLRRVDTEGLLPAGLKVVVDTAGGTAAVVLPALLGRLPLDVLSVNARLDEVFPTETAAERASALARLGELVASSGAAFGAHFDPVGERLHLVDDTGRAVDEERALLVLVDLIAAECRRAGRAGRVAVPVTTTRVVERVARYHGVGIEWTTTSARDLSSAAGCADLVFAGDGRGGYVVPEFSSAIDGIAAFVRLAGLVARTRLSLSDIDARIPRQHLLRRAVPTPWATKGAVMRSVVEAAGSHTLDTTDGVRVVEDDERWALVLPDPSEPVTRIWAEGPTQAAAVAVLERWAGVVQAAAP